MQFITNCPECQRLWKAYSTATTEHIRLEGKLRIAGFEHNAPGVVNLAPIVEEAARKRSESRHAIKKHEAAAHPTKDTTV